MNIRTITVLPTLPQRLQPLQQIAANVWFSWKPEAIRLFQQMGVELWEESAHNPVKMLGMLDQARIDDLLSDEGFLDQLDRIHRAFERYMSDAPAYSYNLEKPADYTVAYFSAEYGLTECLPIYSGGLGVLSGDHLKSASDIRIPLVAVGLLYKEGYFRQYLNAEGWQQERNPDNDLHEMPLRQVLDSKGEPMSVEVAIDGRAVQLYIWKISVGRVALYVLDSNHPANAAQDRAITGQLYGGDREHRLKQEIVLGIGGVRALKRLGIEPAVFHMNEGHSAFASLERIRQMRERGLDFDAAAEVVRATSVFTTHTPVPAGNDYFTPELIKRFFGTYVNEIGINIERLLSLGRINPADRNEHFCMTVLALKSAAWANGVSNIHARVSRSMWSGIWTDLPQDEVPVTGLTNGVHIPSWISYELGLLYDRYLGPRWSEEPDSEKVWERVKAIPDTELWRTHERRRERLVAFARRRLVAQLQRQGAPRAEIETARGILNPEALTIGFARRFATYKRGLLALSDPDRLDRILNDPVRPVQIIFAGKAHPADNNGKEFIRRIVELTREPRFRQRMVFIEDYDMHVARYLVQGADVWLNNPRRPLEACGTSGMKASANGALNMSILDGWWAEAYNGTNGWAIGRGEELADEKYQDESESRAIYELLEKEVVPLFHDRGQDGLPKSWIERMKENLMTVCPVFNTHRMVEDYMVRFYHPAAMSARALYNGKGTGIKKLSEWRIRMNEAWPEVAIREIKVNPDKQVNVYDRVTVTAAVHLGGLKPDEIRAEAYFGRLDGDGQITDSAVMELPPARSVSDATIFEGELPCSRTGRFGVTVRLTPKHDLLTNPLHLNLVKWG